MPEPRFTATATQRPYPLLTLDGVRVHLSRNEDHPHNIVVSIGTDDARADDTAPDGSPYLYVLLNDADLYELDRGAGNPNASNGQPAFWRGWKAALDTLQANLPIDGCDKTRRLIEDVRRAVANA